jgi:dihydroneopterin aldolase
VFCSGLELDVEIGFHEIELGIKQTISVDLALEADFHPGSARDELEGVVDYYEIWRLLEREISGRRFRLVEALAVEIARVVLRAYPHVTARVRVTKRPLQMPRTREVGVECVRTAEDFRS